MVEKLINSVRKVKSSNQDISSIVLETLSKEIENILLQPREGGKFIKKIIKKNTNFCWSKWKWKNNNYR